MIKRIAALLLVAFVFTGAWWDEKKTSTPAPSSYDTYSDTSSDEDTSSSAGEDTAYVKTTTQKTKTKTEASVTTPANPNSTAAALKVLSEGNPDERKARMESLVRLSNALRKQRELKEQQQQQ